MARLACLLVWLSLMPVGLGCPACLDSNADKTLLDRVLESTQAVIALPQPGKPHVFTVREILKGPKSLQEATLTIEAFGKPLNRFLLPGASLLTHDADKQRWLKQTILTKSQERFLNDALNAPDIATSESHQKRLAFFHPYLTHKDTLIATSARQEWARSPYTILHASRRLLDHGIILARLNSGDPSALDFVLLGLCGAPDDIPFIETALDQPEKALAAKLTALLELQGEPALQVIRTRYLSNPKALDQDRAAAITALGVHGTAQTRITRAQAGQALKALFTHAPKQVDLAAPYFTQWQDWSAVQAFRKLRSLDPKILAYLRAAETAVAP